jgi:hypothetical protein
MELLPFSHFHQVSQVQWTNQLLPATGDSGSRLGVQFKLWNWDYLLVLSRYSGDPNVIPDHWLQQVLFACGFRGDLSDSSCLSSVLTAVCFPPQGAAIRAPGVQPTLWNWDYLLALYRYIT